ncbi:MAG: tRNA pseudouridine(13) synthase TruD [Staphylothermus sp.]|nr:tRNA pseudouridine(13) synthase TruD [Staphylothermus sp.]
MVSSKSFIVEELIDWKKLGFDKKDGNYLVLKITKKDMDTFQAIRIISRTVNIPEKNLYILGLKDRDSKSIQYVFINKHLIDKPSDLVIYNDNLDIEPIGFTRIKPGKKHLIGNRFTLVVNEVREYEKAKQLMNIITENGLPSYYGYQRFGVKRPNTHLLGKYIILGRTDLFGKELLRSIYPLESIHSIIGRRLGRYHKLYYEKVFSQSKNPEKALRTLLSILNELYIDAFSSYLYNLLLNKIIDLHGWNELNNLYPMPGCVDSKKYYEDILEKEGITYDVLIKYTKCWYRRGLFKPINPRVSVENGILFISFELEKGYYASIIMRELFKENLLFTQI